MKAILILSCLFFVHLTHAMVLQINQTDSLVYFHPTPFLDLKLTQSASQPTGTLNVTLNYSNTMIQREFNNLVLQYRDYVVKISPATNISTVFTLDLPTVGIRKDLKLRQTNMGPFLTEKIDLSPSQVLRLKNSQEDIEASVFRIAVKSTYVSSVEVERYETTPEFCALLEVVQVSDMNFALKKIEMPVAIQNKDTFDSLKKSALADCFELENANVNSFTELMQARVIVKPGAIAHGSHFEKKPQEQFFEIQPSVDVFEATAE